VEISPSTFFNYFPSKEDLITFDNYDPLLAAAFAARPKDEPLGVAIRRSIVQQLSTILKRDRDVVLARAKLALSVPELRARFWEESQKSENFVRAMIAQRAGRDPDAYELRVAAGIIMGAMFVAVLEWVNKDGKDDLADLVNRALDVVEAGAGL
jgi:AcrR family transcriptional regulator